MARQRSSENQNSRSGTHEESPAPGRETAPGTRIPLLQLLRDLQAPSKEMSGIVDIYRDQVLPAKTRSIHLLGRKSPALIQKTLLGYEVKAFYKRIQCPDIATARYLKLFTDLGCRVIRIPYDPTLTAELIPALEAAVDRIRAGVKALFPDDHERQLYVTRKLYHHLRSQLVRASKQA